MAIAKLVVRKVGEIDPDAGYIEGWKISWDYALTQGQTYQQALDDMIHQFERRFSMQFEQEATRMIDHLNESVVWRQQDLFSPQQFGPTHDDDQQPPNGD